MHKGYALVNLWRKLYLPKQMLMKIVSILLPAFLFTYIVSYAQVVSQDSRGKDVLEVYKAETFTGSFTPGQLSLSLGYSFILGKPIPYITSAGNTTITASHALSLNAKITGAGTESGKPFDLKQQLVRPTYKLEVGYHRTIDKFNDISNIPLFTYSAGIIGFGERSKLNIYDTASKETTVHIPVLLGGRAYLNLFHKSGYFAISVSHEFATAYNKDILKSYQQRENTYIDDNIVSQGDLFGFMGKYQKETSHRSRISLPVFINKYLNINPYYNWYGYVDKTTKKNIGFAFNFFNGSPREKDSRIGKGFGIGTDWVHDGKSWSSPKYFIFGVIDNNFLKKPAAAPKTKGNKNLY